MKQYLRTAKIKIPATGPRYIDWPAYGDNIRIVTCPVPIVVDFHRDDMEPFTMLQGMRKPLAAGTTYNKLTFTRLPANEEGDPFATQDIEIFLAWGFGELEDNLTASSFSNINVEGINKLVEAVQLPTWTRALPRVSGGIEAPGLGFLHELPVVSEGVTQLAVERVNVVFRRITFEDALPEASNGLGVLPRMGLTISTDATEVQRVGRLLRPGSKGTGMASPTFEISAGGQLFGDSNFIEIPGGRTLYARAMNDSTVPTVKVRITEVYRAKVPLA